ncbi:COBW domain-containing protein 1-like [Pyrus ussuriensis x Pyrus communis]|uniref:COBW domain-containing protein 1-like n=1 Tax=Pyrus ussuriensis x Pyrus communis TaxID=2448454 RepID=A0A5N5GC78_9ROSA|nr:COBW domain-containing protein 1-like [Pyrus ussuriensis x Pyrus communis]
MASISADLATTLIGLTSRRSTRLPGPRTFPRSQTLRYSTSSFRRALLAKPNRGYRRFTAAASSATTSQSESSNVLTKIEPDNCIPATIITGFLGSGKVRCSFGNLWQRHCLTIYEHGKRIAVIENEFGEIDIDGSLVAAKTTGAEYIVMLNNGYLCCTVRGDLVRMFADLVNKKKGKFDHIVIETMGLANPAPIIQTFYGEDQVFKDVKLDSVVTLVDAKHAVFHLDEIKPKGVTDLVGKPEIASLVQRIKTINRMAQLKRTEFGKVNLDYVLGIDHDDDHHAHDHVHDPGVSSVSMVCEGSLDLERANIWLGMLLLERSEDIYRMKGLLSVQGMNERFVFQVSSPSSVIIIHLYI